MFVITSPGVLEEQLEDIAFVLADGELLCHTIHVGICGSDRRLWRGEMPASSYPRIPGHEVVAGVVHSNSGKFKDGDIIAVNPYKNCGECAACMANKPNACVRNQTFGVQRNGLLRESFVLDANRAIPLPISDIADARPYWSLVEPLALVIHAATRAHYALDSSSYRNDLRVVVGGGNLGKLTSAYLAAQGYNIIMATDSAEPVEMAGVEIVSRTDAALHYDSADIVYVVGDTKDDIGLAQLIVSNGGVIVVLSHGDKVPSQIDQTGLVFKEVSLIGSRNATNRDFFAAVTLLRTAGHYFEPIIGKVYDMSYDNVVAALSDRGNKSVIRCVSVI